MEPDAVLSLFPVVSNAATALPMAMCIQAGFWPEAILFALTWISSALWHLAQYHIATLIAPDLVEVLDQIAVWALFYWYAMWLGNAPLKERTVVFHLILFFLFISILGWKGELSAEIVRFVFLFLLSLLYWFKAPPEQRAYYTIVEWILSSVLGTIGFLSFLSTFVQPLGGDTFYPEGVLRKRHWIFHSIWHICAALVAAIGIGTQIAVRQPELYAKKGYVRTVWWLLWNPPRPKHYNKAYMY